HADADLARSLGSGEGHDAVHAYAGEQRRQYPEKAGKPCEQALLQKRSVDLLCFTYDIIESEVRVQIPSHAPDGGRQLHRIAGRAHLEVHPTAGLRALQSRYVNAGSNLPSQTIVPRVRRHRCDIDGAAFLPVSSIESS